LTRTGCGSDQGVGKTSAARMLASALFSSTDSAQIPRGLLYFSAHSVRDRLGSLRGEILNYITLCPDALVVLDDLQQWPAQVPRARHSKYACIES
jgi:hypothetical protein